MIDSLFAVLAVLFFIGTTVLFFITTVVLAYYLYKFSKIIMVFEDDLSSSIDNLIQCEEDLNEIIDYQIIYDNEEIKKIYQIAIDQVKICRFRVVQLAERFIERSKQKYVFYDEPEQNEAEEEFYRQNNLTKREQIDAGVIRVNKNSHQ